VYFTVDNGFTSNIREQVDKGNYVVKFTNDDRTIIYNYMATRVDI